MSRLRPRDNPFRVERLESLRYEPEDWTWAELHAKLKAWGYRGAIVGPKGTGKTTLLRDLLPHLAGQGFRARCLQLRQAKKRFSPGVLAHLRETLSERDVVLLDGAEQLSLWRWLCFRRAVRGAGGLLVTTHRPGRLPTLLRTRSTPELLQRCVLQLAPGAGRNLDQLRALHDQHRGNIRNALRDLYDEYV